MNPFKNIAIFRDQVCNCLPWGKDTKETNDNEWEFWPNDPELKPTKFPEKKQYDMDYKYLLQENERLENLVQCLVLQLGKTGEQKDPLKEIEKQMALFDDGGVDGTPRNQ